MGLSSWASDSAAVDTCHQMLAIPARTENVPWTLWSIKDLNASEYFCDWSLSQKKCHLPLRRWWSQLLCVNAEAMSRDGAKQFECTLFAHIMALKDSKAYVANSMAGLKRRMCEGKWRRKWNFGLLNQHGVQLIVWKWNSRIADLRCS